MGNRVDGTFCMDDGNMLLESFFKGGGHSWLGYYFWDKGLKDFVALILVFIMIYYYLINKFYINK